MKKTIINETTRKLKAKQLFKNPSGSRIKTFVIITGENPDAVKQTKSNNKLYNQNLKDKIAFKGDDSFEGILMKGFYPYYKVKGKYGNIEHSFIIYNCSVDDGANLAQSAHQQSFIFGTNNDGKLHFEFWANNSKSFYHYIKVDERDMYIDSTDSEDFYTKISSDFKFTIPLEVFGVAPENMVEAIEQNINSDKNYADNFNKYLDKSMDETLDGKYRIGMRNFLYRYKD